MHSTVSGLSARLGALLLLVSLAAGALVRAADLGEADARREFGYVTMQDGVRLAMVIWRPKPPGRYPTLIFYGPYGNSAAPFAVVQRFLQAGYAVLGVNMRGTGCSEGVDEEGGASRPTTVGKDGAALVEWAAAQPWSSGNVGMIGNSYAGELQLATAANHPPHLKAITASGLAGSAYRDSYMPGGMTHLGGLAAWTLTIQSGLAKPAEEERIAAGDSDCKAILGRQQPINAYGDMKQHPLYESWWTERDGENMAPAITVPTLIMMGWQDEWNLNAATGLFKHVAAKHKRLILQNGGHGVGAPELRGYWMDHQEAMRWLDHWVKGEENGAELDPMVSVYWDVVNAPAADGSHAVPGWKTSYGAWPVPSLRWDRLYLTADGGLSPTPPPPSADNGMRAYLYPTGTELVGDNTQFAVPPFELGALSYRTAPMTADLTLLGLPQLTFFVSSEQNDTDFMVTLKDVDPAGDITYLQRAFLRASLRAIDEARSTPDEVIQSYRHNDLLVPGEITRITLSIPAIGHVLRQGHRLELSILAPSPIPSPHMGGLPLALPSINRVYQSPTYPSTLLLPVVPGDVAQKPAPPCGALQFQPCRPATPAP